MNQEQLKLLSKMKKLVSEGKRKFQIRKDRDYLKALAELEISEAEAWKIILSLNKNYYIPDSKPNYSRTGEALTFIRNINGKNAYIKLKIEQNNNVDETVCLSFHISIGGIK